MKLLTVVPCCKNDSARAEQLLDMHFSLSNRQPNGHCLLVCAPDVHPEMRAKLKISASLAFETVELFDQIQIITLTKHEQCIEMLRQTARYIAHNYTWPWLWLEPDCLPLSSGWLDKLAETYHNQPRRYLGLRMTAASGGITFLSRTAIYPSNAIDDLEDAIAKSIIFDQAIVAKSLHCRLFQWLAVNSIEDAAKVRPDALLLHHDKRGVLLDWVMDKAVNGMTVYHKPEAEPDIGDFTHFGTAPSEAPKRRGRPPTIKAEVATV